MMRRLPCAVPRPSCSKSWRVRATGSRPGDTMRYLSGIQPSGVLHLGNYFGAMKRHVERQEGHECYYFIADYHALTTVREPDVLRRNVLGVALDYLAVGLDPAKAVFFRQSDVPQVVELAWVLSTITSMGLLERCHSFKDKTAKGIEPTHGLFAYPVLMDRSEEHTS